MFSTCRSLGSSKVKDMSKPFSWKFVRKSAEKRSTSWFLWHGRCCTLLKKFHFCLGGDNNFTDKTSSLGNQMHFTRVSKAEDEYQINFCDNLANLNSSTATVKVSALDYAHTPQDIMRFAQPTSRAPLTQKMQKYDFNFRTIWIAVIQYQNQKHCSLEFQIKLHLK